MFGMKDRNTIERIMVIIELDCWIAAAGADYPLTTEFIPSRLAPVATIPAEKPTIILCIVKPV